jgi:hypothetical protein
VACFIDETGLYKCASDVGSDIVHR